VGYRALQLQYRDGTRFELMEPLRESTFFDTFTAKKGWGLHHVTFVVTDLRRAITLLERHGITPTSVFFDDEYWSEAFLHPRDASGTLLQLAQKGPGFLSVDWDTITIEDVLAGRGQHGNGEPSPGVLGSE
jgi:methylmalonyl-CoA/ethylmalonyl-CoA epimerase